MSWFFDNLSGFTAGVLCSIPVIVFVSFIWGTALVMKDTDFPIDGSEDERWNR